MQYIVLWRCLRQVCTRGELFPSSLKIASICLLAFLSYHYLFSLIIASSCYKHYSIIAFCLQNQAAQNFRLRFKGSAQSFVFQPPVSLFSSFSFSNAQTRSHKWLNREANSGFSVQNSALAFKVQTQDLRRTILLSSEQTKARKMSPTNLNSSLTLLYLMAAKTFSAYSYFFQRIKCWPCSSCRTTFCSWASGQATLPAVSRNLVSCSSLSQPVNRSTTFPPQTMYTVGTLLIWKACAICPNLSIFILRSLSFPADSWTRFQRRGVSFLQGPHQSAQKSMSKVSEQLPTIVCQSSILCSSMILSIWFWQNYLPCYLAWLSVSLGGCLMSEKGDMGLTVRDEARRQGDFIEGNRRINFRMWDIRSQLNIYILNL